MWISLIVFNFIYIIKDEGWRVKDEGGLEEEGKRLNLMLTPFPAGNRYPSTLFPTSSRK